MTALERLVAHAEALSQRGDNCSVGLFFWCGRAHVTLTLHRGDTIVRQETAYSAEGLIGIDAAVDRVIARFPVPPRVEPCESAGSHVETGPLAASCGGAP